MNVLFIGAHPDDADIWAGGMLLKCYNRGDKIFIAVMCSGNVGSDGKGARAEKRSCSL